MPWICLADCSRYGRAYYWLISICNDKFSTNSVKMGRLKLDRLFLRRGSNQWTFAAIWYYRSLGLLKVTRNCAGSSSLLGCAKNQCDADVGGTSGGTSILTSEEIARSTVLAPRQAEAQVQVRSASKEQQFCKPKRNKKQYSSSPSRTPAANIERIKRQPALQIITKTLQIAPVRKPSSFCALKLSEMGMKIGGRTVIKVMFMDRALYSLSTEGMRSVFRTHLILTR